MSLSGILKLTGWITLLLLVFIPLLALATYPPLALATYPPLYLKKSTKEHINALYANPFIHDLIDNPQYRDRYLEVLFEHFRSDFQDWPNSRWPTLLQDLELLPAVYCTVDARQDHRLMRDVWERQRQNLQPDPIDDYHQTKVRVPPFMDVFQHDEAHYNSHTRRIRYDFLVKQLQRFVDDYTANAIDTVRKKRRDDMPGRLLRFKALYWLTVLDTFIGTVHLANAVDGEPVASPFPRTVLIRPNLVAQQAPAFRIDSPAAAPVASLVNAILNPVVPPMLYPHQAGSMANPVAHPAGPSGSNPDRSVPSAAAEAPSSGTKRKAADQGGAPSQGSGKGGPGGAMRSMDCALKPKPQVGQLPKAQQSNSAGSCTALAWISVIMVTVAVSLMSFA